MSDKEGGDDFQVFLTISEYRKYKGLQKLIDQGNENMKKERQAFEEKLKLQEKLVEDTKKELGCSNNDIQRITLQCLQLKKERISQQQKLLQMEITCEKLKKTKLQSLEQSTVEKIGNQKKVVELKSTLESLEKQNRELTENLTEVTEAYKQLESKNLGSIKATSSQIVELKSKLEVFSKELSVKSKELTQVKKLSQSKINESVIYSQEVQKLKEHDSNLEKRLTEMALNLRESNSKNEMLKSQLSAFESDIREFTLRMTLQQNQISQLKNSNNRLGKEKEERAAEYDHLNTEKDKAFSLNKQKQQTILSFGKTIDQQADLIRRLESQFQQMNEDKMHKNLALTQDLNRAQDQISNLKLTIKQLQNSASKPIPLPDNKNLYSSRISELLKKFQHLAKYEELRDQIESLMVLEEQYEKIIADDRSTVIQLKQENRQLYLLNGIQKEKENKYQSQLQNASSLLDDLMKESGKGSSKSDVELMLAKEEIERLKDQKKKLEATHSDTQKIWGDLNNELKESIKKLADKCNELKNFEGIIENPDMYVDYYVNLIGNKLKELRPNDASRILNDNIDQFIRKLSARKVRLPSSAIRKAPFA